MREPGSFRYLTMESAKTKARFKEWLRRYIVAELLGTLLALGMAYVSFAHSHSYALAAGAGFVGEGIGFYGYFIAIELFTNSRAYAALPVWKRLLAVAAKSSTNLIIEFAPAEIIDSFLIRPFLMFYMPQHIKPYALGFISGKLSADVLFYVFAIVGYEYKKRRGART